MPEQTEDIKKGEPETGDIPPPAEGHKDPGASENCEGADATDMENKGEEARSSGKTGGREQPGNGDSDFNAAFPAWYWDEDGAPPGEEAEEPEVPANKPSSSVAEQEDGNDGATMGLLDHLNELRSRLTKACVAVAVGFAICWAFVDPLFDVLIRPLLAVMPEGTHAQYTTLPEAFFTRMYIAFVAGLFLASPAIFYQIWAFVAPGLYDEEKRYIIPIALLSALFFVGGAAFCYFIVFPYAFAFFISYSTPEIVITPKMSDYLSFTIKLLFAFGIIFEMPIFTLFLARLGIVTAAMMRRLRKYAIVAIFILAAILTPPDVLSQLLMALPMLLLYEVSIGVAVVFGKRKPGGKDAVKNAEEGARS